MFIVNLILGPGRVKFSVSDAIVAEIGTDGRKRPAHGAGRDLGEPAPRHLQRLGAPKPIVLCPRNRKRKEAPWPCASPGQERYR